MSSLKHSNTFQKVYETTTIPFLKFMNKSIEKREKNSKYSCATHTFVIFSFSL